MKIEESIQTSKFNTPNVAVFLIDVQESLLNGIENKDQLILIKNLNKQLDQISVGSILSDKSKNILKDEKINNINVRFQKVIDLPFKDLRKLIDEGKK